MLRELRGEILVAISMIADLETHSCQCVVILVSWFFCQALPFHGQGQAISGDLSAMLLSRWKESEDVFQSDHCGSQMTCFKSVLARSG